MTQQTNHRDHVLPDSYAAERIRVDAAYRVLRQLLTVPHSPSQVRRAAQDLSVALQHATAAAARGRQAAAPPPTSHHRRAVRAVPAAVRPWSAELGRLADIGVWLRRTSLDEKGVSLPAVARVANYAAKGPHICGLDFGNQAAETPDGPRIGIDLRAAIDGKAAGTTLRPDRPAPAMAADKAKQS